jgi:hypothetical protein
MCGQGELVATGHGLPHGDDVTVNLEHIAGGEWMQGDCNRVVGMEPKQLGRKAVDMPYSNRCHTLSKVRDTTSA